MQNTLFESTITSLPLLGRGKVRDLYAVGSDMLLLVTTDRLSAFDVVLPTPIPGKGRILTDITRFWMHKIESELGIPNALVTTPLSEIILDPAERAQVEERSLLMRRVQALPIEAVVRQYLIGSGWKDYNAHGTVCGISLPPGLRLAERLPKPIFTPSTKAALGAHDENIAIAVVEERLGSALAGDLREKSLRIFAMASQHAAARGILIADTKFEFGLDAQGRLLLIDEVLTPDSSRFWPADRYIPGTSPESFDKQFVRDYLETLDWGKTAPGPPIPASIVAQTTARYQEALDRLTS